MNKFFLTFQSSELEAKYQVTQTTKMKRPVYIFMIFSLLIMNLLTLAYHFLSDPIYAWQMNLCFTVFCVAQIIIVIVMNKMKYFQLAITLTNIFVCLLELNVNEATKTKVEFFAYGATFMQFQGVLYLISDFPYAVTQIVSHLIVRLVITIVKSKDADYILISNGFFTMVLLSMAIFAKDKHERNTFIANLKDNHFDNIASFLISEPYFRVVLNRTSLLFEVTHFNCIIRFPGYNPEYCEGCNARLLLRSYLNGNRTLEQSLLNKESLSLPGVFSLINHKLKFKVRVTEFEIQNLSFLIILEENRLSQDTIQNFDSETNKLKFTLKQHNNLLHQKYFNLGVLSILLLQKRVLKRIDIQNLLRKLIILVCSDSIKNKIEIKTQENCTTFLTYSYQLKIFLIQVINITLQLEKMSNDRITIQFLNYQNHIDMIFRLKKGQKFIRKFDNNYFIRETRELLIEKMFSTENMINLSFKNYPIGSFYNSKKNDQIQ